MKNLVRKESYRSSNTEDFAVCSLTWDNLKCFFRDYLCIFLADLSQLNLRALFICCSTLVSCNSFVFIPGNICDAISIYVVLFVNLCWTKGKMSKLIFSQFCIDCLFCLPVAKIWKLETWESLREGISQRIKNYLNIFFLFLHLIQVPTMWRTRVVVLTITVHTI